ncbi:hypothetical protein JOF29_000372 [Kribbella aluminosa]|uniref:Nudix hydrolase domain-containing protein n=1 Tax=Kribbella aluminosa TaxID=416017 RepID=A0ABS4UCB4_9ACTN|nr:hypothetical protein [Kribbella aluminosa]MBP2349289.1 hypothetical protein [Kribbella aluminosa]
MIQLHAARTYFRPLIPEDNCEICTHQTTPYNSSGETIVNDEAGEVAWFDVSELHTLDVHPR